MRKMMKMKKRAALCLVAIVFIVAFSTLPASAFDGNDYSGGGGSDSGGSYYSSDGGGSGSLTNGELAAVLACTGVFYGALFFRLLYYPKWKKRRDKRIGAKKKSGDGQGGAAKPGQKDGLPVKLPNRTARIEKIIKEHDPDFSAKEFVTFVKGMYKDIQKAWCKRDMAPVRALLHDNLYDTTAKQVQAKIDQGVVYHYKNIRVGKTWLTSYARDGQFEYLTLCLNASMIDWQEDEKTGEILRGDKTSVLALQYKMKFMRSSGVLTKEGTAGVTGTECPGCGAPLDIASSAKCTYCGAVVTTGKYSWVLSDFGTVRGDTVDEGVRKG